jgi:hypothetical protein
VTEIRKNKKDENGKSGKDHREKHVYRDDYMEYTSKEMGDGHG